jgi:hypothetical protein
MLQLILYIVLGIIGLSVLYIGLEVGLYLKWAISQDPDQNTSFEKYSQENQEGILARFCG